VFDGVEGKILERKNIMNETTQKLKSKVESIDAA
jgi:hypothetical protein